MQKWDFWVWKNYFSDLKDRFYNVRSMFQHFDLSTEIHGCPVCMLKGLILPSMEVSVKLSLTLERDVTPSSRRLQILYATVQLLVTSNLHRPDRSNRL